MTYFFRGRNQQRTQQPQQQRLTQVLPETLWVNDSLPSGIPPEESAVVTISRQFGKTSLFCRNRTRKEIFEFKKKP